MRRRALKLTQNPGDRYEIFDSGGFGLRLGQRAKSFILVYRHLGGPRRLTLDRYPAMRLADARVALEGITQETAKGQTRGWQTLLPDLERVNAGARFCGQTRFTALLHHVDVAALERAFRRQRRAASPGVDRASSSAVGGRRWTRERLGDRASARSWPMSSRTPSSIRGGESQ